uniref:Uncharacterized protein n=1 Tax=Anguilla anguilla TaxID=7936 RepID=A0A0E9PFJ2_ANGAN
MTVTLLLVSVVQPVLL